MRLAFTGTRKGLTTYQADELWRWVRANWDNITQAHHGCCVGADEAFDQAVRAIRGAHRVTHLPSIHYHPPYTKRFVFKFEALAIDRVHDERDYLDRNREMVDACDTLVACPDGPEQLRSGTWSTVRYARKRGLQVVIIYPSKLED